MSEIARLVAEVKAMPKPRRKPKTLHIGEDRARAFLKEYVDGLVVPHEDPAIAFRELFESRKAMVHGATVTWGGH